MATLARSSFAAQPVKQLIEIVSAQLTGNGLFDLVGSGGVSLNCKCLVQISTWIQLAETPNSDKTLLIQSDTTATTGGGLFTLASAGIVNNVANAALAAALDPTAIITTLIMTDLDVDLTYGYLTLLATPVA